MTLGLGYGLGYAMANCQHDFTGLPSPHLRPVLTTPPVVQTIPPAGGDAGVSALSCRPHPLIREGRVTDVTVNGSKDTHEMRSTL